jgi:hypothetical protein
MDRIQKPEFRIQKTEDRRQKTEERLSRGCTVTAASRQPPVARRGPAYSPAEREPVSMTRAWSARWAKRWEFMNLAET